MEVVLVVEVEGMVGRAKVTRNVGDMRKTRRGLTPTRACHTSCWLVIGKAQLYMTIVFPASKILKTVPNIVIVGF